MKINIIQSTKTSLQTPIFLAKSSSIFIILNDIIIDFQARPEILNLRPKFSDDDGPKSLISCTRLLYAPYDRSPNRTTTYFFLHWNFFRLFCRCFIHQARSNQQPPAPASPRNPPGLERKLMDSFPTFTYAAVKDLRIEKFGLECAICICEFVDDDVLRLLNKCCHVFHHDCIDLWLESNKTCPVCRRNLEIDVQQPVPMCGINEDELLHEIDIRNSVGDRMGGDRGAARVERTEMSDKFPRSHSTGHSIKKRKELENERYTLRLPEHLHARLFRGHKSTGSCTSFGEFTASTSTSNGGFGEISDFAGGDVNRVQQAMHIAN